MRFEPIAIVGQSCILPGALSPAALWDNVLAGQCALRSAPQGRWALPHALTRDASVYDERAWSDVGGYVEGFEALASQAATPLPDRFVGLDLGFQWLLHGAREVLRAVGHEGRSARAGLIAGNLSFPTPSMVRHAQGVWLDQQGPSFLAGAARQLAGVNAVDPRNRFMSGLPALLVADELGLDAGALALDAACASSLYALKLACDWLHDGKADLMVAGAVNAADRIFLHVGFSALSALSRTGRSRPFDREADGLVPAEGAAFVVLKRLPDALAAGDDVLAVIRGIGLSNDGRGRGLLVPSEDGQVRAMQRAYAEAELSPSDVAFVECHATGTPVGDATELASMARVFSGAHGLPIGSIKANLGHPVTAAGMAGLLKLIAGLRAGVLPPMPAVGAPLTALEGAPFRLLERPEPWLDDRPRRVALNAFGFGGNNAHLLLEHVAERPTAVQTRVSANLASALEPVAVIGLSVLAGDDASVVDFSAQLFAAETASTRRTVVDVALEGLRFPPNDMQAALPHQALLLEAARKAVRGLRLPREQTGVLVGMGTDPEVARYGTRWQLRAWAEAWAASLGAEVSSEWLAQAQAAFQEPLSAAGVLGTMPNVFANRVNSQLDLAGPSLSVSTEELSGVTALELAMRALQKGEIDAALVGAVDCSDEVVHRSALAALGRADGTADAAVVLVLKRLCDAERDGEPVLAVFSASEPELLLGQGRGRVDLLGARGRAHAASGLLQVASGVLAVQHGVRPAQEGAPLPWFGRRVAEVEASSDFAPSVRVRLEAHAPATPYWFGDVPELSLYAGRDRNEVLAALALDQRSSDGPARLAIVATRAELPQRRREAERYLRHGGPVPDGVAFSPCPSEGELAFVFTGAAAAYPGMASELLLALPELAAPFHASVAGIPSALAAVQRGFDVVEHPLDQLWSSSLVCQAHAVLTRQILKLSPQAVLGYSSGETNQLFAMGAWRDLGAMVEESMVSPIFRQEIAGELRALAHAWGARGHAGPVDFGAYAVAASAASVERALSGEPLAHLTIINGPEECVLSGEAAACARVLEKLGRARALPIPYRLAAHCPELEVVREPYHELHRRETFSVPDVRFYWAAFGQAREPSAELAARALTELSVHTLDFPRLIERAYADGVRVFVEHGPKGLCSGWIDRILKDRPHLTVALDLAGRDSLQQVFSAVARLSAAGLSVDFDALRERLRPVVRAPSVASLHLPAHGSPIRLPLLDADVRVLPLAPPLVTVLPEDEGAAAAPPSALAPRAAATVAETRSEVPSLRELRVERAAQAAPHEAPQLALAAGAESEQRAVRGARSSAHHTSADPARATLLAQTAARHVRVAAVHREFLALQAEAQQRYLTLQTNLLSSLRTPRTGQPTARALRLTPPAVEPSHDEALQRHARVSAAVANSEARPALAQASAADVPLPESEPSLPRHKVRPSLPEAQRARESAGENLALRPEGPTFSREQLIVHASGSISTIFGPDFAQQDGYHRQVRMPQPPLLLADRVTGIRGAAGSMGTGTIWTETDVREDSWYLHQGRMPGGLMIEAGQADLMLISWLGVDRLNKSERVYRLLGCDLTYHGSLPAPGDTLRYDIHIDGHAKQGDIRLFFFHYDCHIDGRLVLSVRNGQAGFFTDQELRASAGVLWDAATAEHSRDSPLDPPFVTCEKSSFERDELRAFSEGRPAACFGRGFEAACAHVASPRVAGARMLLLSRVTHFAPRGGPWQRGYLRAELDISSDDWFFAGHFKNDPCMPGTLMFEGCLQAMAFYLGALGFTLERDGYRFEPVPELRSTMRCRGQVSPHSERLVYEVFVEAVSAGPIPLLKADLLCTVDGLKAFHAQGVGLRLVPDWPLEVWQHNPVAAPARGRGAALALHELGGLRDSQEPKPVASHDGFAFDYRSLLACAWGRPSAAFGRFYERFDSPRRVARLPGPPYHFISRVVRTDGAQGDFRAGAAVEVEYDIPPEVWYFDDNGSPTMPFCVLMEAALQPCGWLASYVGSTLALDSDLMFRNLDGTATLKAEIRPGPGCLRTKARLLNVSRSGEMIIESFSVECLLDGVSIYEMNTVFGFFPKAAFDNQAGLPVSAEERARIECSSSYLVDLRSRPEPWFGGAPRLASGMLWMLDRVTAYEPEGGSRKLGWLRAEKDVDPSEWFFKAHFFQDPVQPGSLGIEALCQLLQFAMVERNLMAGVQNPRFEPVALERQLTWKYRGQVVPKNRVITSELELLEIGTDERGVYALADAWLWVDGKRIYQAKNLGMRIVGQSAPSGARAESLEPDATVEPSATAEPEVEVLDPSVDTWLGDHRPTFTMPALPMMSMIDRMVLAARRHTGQPIRQVLDAQVHRWLTFPGGPVRLRTEVHQDGPDLRVELHAFRAARDPLLSRFEPVASARVRAPQQADVEPPPAWPRLSRAELQPDPYAHGALFHGPSFQLLCALRLGPEGASAVLDLARCAVPRGALGQGVLDALTHAIPHDALHSWSSQIPEDCVGYPYRVPYLQVYDEVPTEGLARVEARFVGFDGSARFPITDLQLIVDERVYVALRLVEVLLPKGPIGQASPAQRRSFLRDRSFVPDLSLSRRTDDVTELADEIVKESDWLPGNVAAIYAASPALPLVEQVAIKEHIAPQLEVHPAFVLPTRELRGASVQTHPLRHWPLEVVRHRDLVRVRNAGAASLDLYDVRAFWRAHFGIGPWPVEDLYCALAKTFVEDVVITDPVSFARHRGRSVLYLANHQVAVESLMFSVLIAALTGSVTTTLAKIEHQHSWIGRLIQRSFCYPGVRDPGIIAFFDRENQTALPEILRQIGRDMEVGRSAMIHVEGTRALSCRQPVVKLSSAVVDLALAVGAPIVPVRFTGGLPTTELTERLEFPLGFGKQTLWIGRALEAKQLSSLPLKERKQAVIEGINELGPGPYDEPSSPQPVLAERIQRWMKERGVNEDDATLLATLRTCSHESPLTARLLKAAPHRRTSFGSTPEEAWLGELAAQLFGS